MATDVVIKNIFDSRASELNSSANAFRLNGQHLRSLLDKSVKDLVLRSGIGGQLHFFQPGQVIIFVFETEI